MIEVSHGDGGASPIAALVQLMTWLSPGFPIGAFAYSHGIEAAIARGQILDADTLHDWLAVLLSDGSGWNDLVLFAASYEASRRGDVDGLREASELGLAMGGSRERREETRALGAAFTEASHPWRAAAAPEPPMSYPVAVASLAAERGIPKGAALAAFAHGFIAGLVAAATRLVPLGQSDAVAVMARLEAPIVATAARAEGSTLDDLGSASILSDIAAMHHEILSSRLFRS